LGVFRLVTNHGTEPLYLASSVERLGGEGRTHHSLVTLSIASVPVVALSLRFMEPRGLHSTRLRALLPWRIDLSFFSSCIPPCTISFCHHENEDLTTSTPPSGGDTEGAFTLSMCRVDPNDEPGMATSFGFLSHIYLIA